MLGPHLRGSGLRRSSSLAAGGGRRAAAERREESSERQETAGRLQQALRGMATRTRAPGGAHSRRAGGC